MDGTKDPTGIADAPIGNRAFLVGDVSTHA